MRDGQGGVRLAVRTYLDHLTIERGLAANTLTSYRRDLRRYQQFLAELRSTTSTGSTRRR